MEAAMFKCFKKICHDQAKAIQNNELAFIEESKKKDTEFERKHQKTLIEAHNDKRCVYIIRVTPIIDDEYVVKIGETADIKKRIQAHAVDFEECVLLEVIPTVEAHRLEQYILKRPDIICRRIAGTETINIDKDFTCRDLVSIIKKSKVHIEASTCSTEDRHAIQTRELISEIMRSDFDTETKLRLIDEILNLTPSATVSADPYIETPTSRRVYKYKPDDLTTPIHTYLSLREAARSTHDPQVHDYHIRDASKANTVVADHRWFFVDETPDNMEMLPPLAIPDTFVASTEIRKTSSLVAQISKDKSHVIKVYQTTNDAAAAVNTKACNITIAKQKKQKSRGFFWAMWDDLDEDLKSTYTEPVPAPFKQKTCSKGVAKIDPNTNEIVEEFDCFQDVVNKYRICHKKLNLLCASGDIYKGFVWRRR
jgi:hypothetical protein